MATLYRHRVYCMEAAGWVTLWKDNPTPLTVCPDNPAHEINPGSWTIVEEKNDHTVHISKEIGFKTGGHFKVESIVVDVPAANPGETTEVVFTKQWPIDIAIHSVRISVPAGGVGSSCTFDIAPRTPVGVLVAAVAQGAATIQVASAALAQPLSLADPGYYITLAQGASIDPAGHAVLGAGPVQELGRAISIDRATGDVVVEVPTTSEFAAGTLVMYSMRPCDNLELMVPGLMVLGDDRPSAMLIPKGVPIAVAVSNPSVAPITITFYVHYAY